MSDDEECDVTKVVIIGESGVGKTCIIERFCQNKFTQTTVSTIGAANASATVFIGEKGYDLDIWDTAGQELYRSLNKIFYKNAKIAILVYDITKKASFEEMKKKYQFLMDANQQNIIICVCGNKSDLADKQVVPDEEVREFTVQNCLQFTKVSAKTGEGMQEFASLLENHLSAFVGQSGVGKSSLINVMDNSCVLKTGSLSKKYGRGSHTTTKGTLIHLTLNETLTEGVQGLKANIIDTPGIRRFVLDDISADELALYFREFEPFIGKCKFGLNCKHNTEPGCAIIQAVNDRQISQERYDSWLRISEEIRTGAWSD